LFALYLFWGQGGAERRGRGEVACAHVVFWSVAAILLNFLLFGLIANIDLFKFPDLSLLQAVNGSLNAVIAYTSLLLLRIVQARGDWALRVCHFMG
jgi:hypothetical protein